MTLASEYANSKLVDVVTVTVADFDDGERVGNSLVVILTLNIGQYIKAAIWSRF